LASSNVESEQHGILEESREMFLQFLVRDKDVPIRKVKSGYKWGKSGKVYPTKKQAEKQAQAIYASGYKKKKRASKKKKR